jgi:alkylation response protein AidB-like acyl-CoA dehydrogenase
MQLARDLPSPDAEALLGLAEEIAHDALAPAAADAEETATFPSEAFSLLGQTGLLSLPYSETYGGGEQPYAVYLQVLEVLAHAWLSVAMGVSVHALACFPLARFGTDAQRTAWLPDMLSGSQLGAYCLSEPESGSDAGSLQTQASQVDDGYEITGTKAWISHAGHADFYLVFARTSDTGPRGISCFHVPASTGGVFAQTPERKMGLRASHTAQMLFDAAPVGADQLIGERDGGFAIALAALDHGRLGIAACAVGLAQSAFDLALGWSEERVQFGAPIGRFQGIEFMLADMATRIDAARSQYLAAARLKDRGADFSMQAAMSKLNATDTAMSVCTDAVQVLGGYGYVADYPAERYLREAKALQILEGTNQIQRVVIARHLRRSHGASR